MPALYRYLFPAMWLAWAAYWWLSSRNVKSTVRRESLASRLSHTGPLLLAVLLLLLPNVLIPFLSEGFMPAAGWQFPLAAAVIAAGLLFAAWARAYIGTNWSAIVTIKEGHELITGGPYGLVRHPIYTGLLLAIVGSAIAVGEWRAILAVVLAALSFWRKLRLEESWMRQQFGERYRAYSRHVAALIPFVL